MNTLAQLQAENEVLRNALIEADRFVADQIGVQRMALQRQIFYALNFCPAPDGKEANPPDVFRADGAGQSQPKWVHCPGLTPL